MRSQSFTKAFDRYWGSLQESELIRKSAQITNLKKLSIFNTDLSRGIKTSFIMQDMKTSSINGSSHLGLKQAMDKLDLEIRKNGMRLGDIKSQSWERARTMSGLYKVKDDPVFVLVQETITGSLIQIQQTSKLSKNEFRKILTDNKLVF